MASIAPTQPDIEQTQITAELTRSREETDRLFRLVSPEDLFLRPLPQRHRLIFYVGHLEAFDWNQLRSSMHVPAVDENLDQLFARGIDPEPGKLPHDEVPDWPTLEQTLAYCRRVRAEVDRIWDDAPADVRHTLVEHRWMHAETLAYLLHNLPDSAKLQPPAKPEEASGSVRAIVDYRMVTVPTGQATLGRSADEGFGWDNEFERHTVEVPGFSISRYKVTNAQYLEFVAQGQPAPHFWVQEDGEWFWRGMFGLTPLQMDAPVYATWAEAAGYCAWKGCSLPSEAQFHRAAYGTPEGNEREYPWGSDSEHPEVNGNFDFQHWDPVSVLAYPGGRSAFGVAQMVGNGWEWTSTVFGPFKGFHAQPNYPGYSADFFDGRHYVMKGGSPRTARALTRRSFRNWFRPDYPYVYSTFRAVESAA